MPLYDSSTYNYSLLSVPATYLVGMVTHTAAIYLVQQSKEIPDKFDNRNPRAYLSKVSERAKTSADVRRFMRAEAAQTNIFEHIGVYSAAIVAANFARLPVATLNKLAAGYFASRVAYCVLYVQTERAKYTPLRSLAWFLSQGVMATLFIKATINLNKALW